MRPTAQGGQAMLFTLLFAGVTALICLVLYNSGMLANTRTQLQNAADAGAYSGGVLLARDHNFSAYTNRAMVANQVSVAQLVSMKSYTQDAAATHNRLRGTAHQIQSNIVPLVKPPTWNFALNLPMQALASTYASAAPGAVVTLDRLIRLFEGAQHMHHNATALNIVLTANDVVKRNDRHASISLMTFQTGYFVHQVEAWRNFTAQHNANGTSAAADRFANVVVSKDSTDQFIRDRGSVLPAAWISTPTPAACPASIPVLTVYGFDHDGGTLLSNDKKRWLALDATLGAGFVACDAVIPYGYPLLADGAGGSGGAVAGANGRYATQTGFSGNPSEAKRYGGALTNPLTAIPANRRYNTTGPGNSLDSPTGGLQNYYRDMAKISGSGATPANQSAAQNGGQVPFTIEVYRDADTIRTSARVLSNAAATVSAPETLKGNKMRVLSSAHAYFYRSKVNTGFTKTGWARADNKTEMANLFNPYWQAALVDNPDEAYALSIGSP